MADYYKILGISKSASPEEIKKAYRKLSFVFHPDRNNGDVFFENMFKQVQEAYTILGDPIKRDLYDRNYKETINKSTQTNGNSNFEPTIEYFKSDKRLFYSGDNIKLEWKTYNADLIEIKPFGIFNASGSKTFKLNNINKQYLNLELKATNTNISKSTSQKIKLENKIFRDANRNFIVKSFFSRFKPKAKVYDKTHFYENEKYWSPRGRLSKKALLEKTSFLVISYIIFFLFFIVIFSYVDNTNDYYVNFLVAILLMVSVVYIYALIIQIIKRIHDVDFSAWWSLILLIPVANIIFLLFLYIDPGIIGPNRFGPDPNKR